MSPNTRGDNDFAGARRVAFAKIFDEYTARYGADFRLAWDFDVDPKNLCDRFLEDLAHRLEGRSVREIGQALAPTRPEKWTDHERGPWLGALGSWAIFPLAEEDRAHLVGTAHVLGLEALARRWGLRW